MILKWLFPGPTADGDKSSQVPSSQHANSPVESDVHSAPPTGRVTPFVSLPTAQEVMTATATIIVYDLVGLSHRLDDECDWWADPKDELSELKRRNLLILGVGADGFYDVEVATGENDYERRFSLHFPSGEVFIGPGEEVTGGGNVPTGEHGGFFVSVEPGDYEVAVSRVNDERIGIVLKRGIPFENTDMEPVTI